MNSQQPAKMTQGPSTARARSGHMAVAQRVPLELGDVVLARVPFDHCAGSKPRPAVVVLLGEHSVCVCPFYSKPRLGTTYVGATIGNGLDHGSNLAYRYTVVEPSDVYKRLGVINASIAKWLLPGTRANSGPSSSCAGSACTPGRPVRSPRVGRRRLGPAAPCHGHQ